MDALKNFISCKSNGEFSRHKTVLVIDDNADFVKMSKIFLESDRYAVVTAAGGAEALAILSNVEWPDLIVLDYEMATMSGGEFLKILEVRIPEVLDQVPIIFLSALDSVPVSKAIGFLRKPCSMAKYLAAVEDYIEVGVPRFA